MNGIKLVSLAFCTLISFAIVIDCFLHKRLFPQIAPTPGFVLFLTLLITYLKGRNSTIMNKEKSGKIFLRVNFKFISFASYNSNFDIGIRFQFFSKF
jgi:hypothetical protein